MRVFNTGTGNGEERGVPTLKRRGVDGKVKEFVRVPPKYSGCTCSPSGSAGRVTWDGICRCGKEALYEHKAGNVYLALDPHGFFCIEKGQAFNVPAGIQLKTVTSLCPHLVPEEEHEFAQEHPAAEPKPDGKQTKK